MRHQKTNEKPLRKWSEKVVIEKFCGRGNAHEWLKQFENECLRLEIKEMRKKLR